MDRTPRFHSTYLPMSFEDRLSGLKASISLGSDSQDYGSLTIQLEREDYERVTSLLSSAADANRAGYQEEGWFGSRRKDLQQPLNLSARKPLSHKAQEPSFEAESRLSRSCREPAFVAWLHGSRRRLDVAGGVAPSDSPTDAASSELGRAEGTGLDRPVRGIHSKAA